MIERIFDEVDDGHEESSDPNVEMIVSIKRLVERSHHLGSLLRSFCMVKHN